MGKLEFLPENEHHFLLCADTIRNSKHKQRMAASGMASLPRKSNALGYTGQLPTGQ